MRKSILFALLIMMGMAEQAQNVQLHYDLGRNIYPDEEAGRQKVNINSEIKRRDVSFVCFFIAFRE